MHGGETDDKQKNVRLTFRKSERLCSGIAIGQLLQLGSALNHFPFRLLYLAKPGNEEKGQKSHTQLAISVPKKKFKHAADRNLLKRRIREAYRLNKQPFYEEVEKRNLTLNILLVYVSTEILPYSEIEDKLNKLLERLNQRIEKDAGVSIGNAG